VIVLGRNLRNNKAGVYKAVKVAILQSDTERKPDTENRSFIKISHQTFPTVPIIKAHRDKIREQRVQNLRLPESSRNMDETV
jgi:hypothetical protein